MSNCPLPGALAAHARGELDPLTSSEVESHLAGCERCRLGILLLKEASTLSGRGTAMNTEPPTEGHLSPEEVYQLVEKTLPRKRRREVEDHLDRCPDCVTYLATVLGSERPASAEEEAALSQIPESGPSELLARLRARIIATSPGPTSRRRLRWRQILPVAAAVAGFAVLLAVLQSFVIGPLLSRRLVAQAMTDLVTLRQGTGRVPLRYIPGFQRARVTRSGFDVADPSEEAIESAIESRLRRAVGLARGEAEARLALGLFLLDTGRLDESEAQLREALEADPNSVDTLNGMSVLFFERSLRDADRAIELRREGLTLLQRAHRMDPDNLMVSYNLAVFHQEIGSLAAARRAWLAYLDRDGRSEWAQVARENLRSLGGG